VGPGGVIRRDPCVGAHAPSVARGVSSPAFTLGAVLHVALVCLFLCRVPVARALRNRASSWCCVTTPHVSFSLAQRMHTTLCTTCIPAR
jgi:hypothetical protein